MRHYSWPIGIFAIACGLLASAAPAWAANFETWVSGAGSDAGSCPIAAPCATFAYAHGQTSNGGAINVLSSGNFGPVHITKSISIVADGVEAVINTAVAGGAAIIINGSAIVVSLRGLTIDLRGTANKGISFVSGAALHVHDCTIRRSTNGILFAPASGTSELYVVDSAIADTSQHSILVVPSGSGGAKVMLDRVRVENASSSGIVFTGESTTGSISATVRDSVSAGGDTGIYAFGSGGGTTNVMVDRSASVNNLDGIRASSGGTIRIGDSMVTGNVLGWPPSLAA